MRPGTANSGEPREKGSGLTPRGLPEQSRRHHPMTSCPSSILRSYFTCAGLELAGWNHSGHRRPVLAKREVSMARRDEIERG